MPTLALAARAGDPATTPAIIPIADVAADAAASGVAPPRMAEAEAPPYAHRECYATYFARLAGHADATAAARRLLSHIEADLDGEERVALWQALWRCASRLSAAERERLAAALDGRHAERLSWLFEDDWAAPRLIERLALGAALPAARPRFVPALLAHHGIAALEQPAAASPAVVLAAAAARLAGAGRLGPDEIALLQAAVLDACSRDDTRIGEGLSAIFELALHAGDEATAAATLAQLVNAGLAGALRVERVRGWLDGTAFDDDEDAQQPLALATRWERGWLRPAAWSSLSALAALHTALQREAPRRRVQQLAAAVAPGAVLATCALDESHRALAALDHAYLLADHGGDPVPVLRKLTDGAVFAAAAAAALYRASARHHAARGDLEAAAVALVKARRARPTAGVRCAIAQLLPGAPVLDSDARREEALWQSLRRQQPDSPLGRVAAFQLATLWTEGALEPRVPAKCQRLDPARALWSELSAAGPASAFAAAAQRALSSSAFTRLQPALVHEAGIEALWFERPGADRVTIVFSCVASHHTFPDVAQLVGALPGQHLLFVRNPEKNWYSDAAFDAVCSLIRSRLLTRFAPAQLRCYYGSMGGHGALKVALHLGLRAIAFNPQTDLDLWAAFRSGDRAHLWGADRHARLADWPLVAWARAPLYVACGSDGVDRDGLSALIALLRRCDEATAIVEKFALAGHAGLMARICRHSVPQSLQRIGQRLDDLAVAAPAAGARALDGGDAQAFWDRLDEARSAKVEIQLRGGVLWWQASAACDTR